MNILLVNHTRLPAVRYGGVERVIWWLGRELVRLGHNVTYLVAKGSSCPFAKVLAYNPDLDINSQVPDYIDIAHFSYEPANFTKKPYLVTIHTNPGPGKRDQNSVFVSANHAARYGSTVYVHNPIDTASYAKPDYGKKRNYFHFLAKAAWRVKNVKGAIEIATMSNSKLVVMGGTRLNIKMGFRFTPNLNIGFKGTVDDIVKARVMNASKGLLFPVLWHEPFGIAITESLYYGCPVFGTPYGSLPELVPVEVGLLSASKSALAEGLKNAGAFDARRCHDYAVEHFNINCITNRYLDLYGRVLKGETLNSVAPDLVDTNRPKFLPFYD